MEKRKIINKNSTQAISTLIIVAIVVVIVVVAAVGIYAATRNGKTSPSPSATPTASPSSSATATPTSTATATTKPTSTSGIATSSSYEFNVTGTAPNGTIVDTGYYAAKNLGTSNVDLITVVTTPSSGTLEYIINGAQQKAWVYQDGQWTDISTAFTSIQPSVQSTAGAFVNMLTYYGGSGSFTYTVPNGQPNAGYTDTFTNVHVNPSLPDSLFQGPS